MSVNPPFVINYTIVLRNVRVLLSYTMNEQQSDEVTGKTKGFFCWVGMHDVSTSIFWAVGGE